MRQIPKQYLHFYSPAQISSMHIREQLRRALQERNELSRLEEEIIREAFTEIAQREMEINVTLDLNVYKRDLKRMKKGKENIVYILCDKNGCFKPIGVKNR